MTHPHAEQLPIPGKPGRMLGPLELAPVELAGEKGRFRERVGDACAGRWVLKGGEARKLLAPTRAHVIGELAAEIAEELEGTRSAPFLAHEQHWYLWQQQIGRGHGAQCLRAAQHTQALAQRAIADLIVILNEGDEGR